MVSSFANAYYDTTKVPIVGVSSSEGNTSIDEWLPGTSFFEDLLQRTESAKQYLNQHSEYHLRNSYLVWCQGENDGDKGMSEEEYYHKLNDMVNTLLEKTDIKKVFLVKIGNRADDLSLYDSIKKAQEKLCQDSDDCILVSEKFETMLESGLMKDIYHYTQDGYNIVGKEAGENAGKYVLTEVGD